MNVLFSLTDPMEQNDFYNPTRRPKQIALVTLNAQTQPMTAQTQPIPTITTTNITEIKLPTIVMISIDFTVRDKYKYHTITSKTNNYHTIHDGGGQFY
jgi:hypothetical protein